MHSSRSLPRPEGIGQEPGRAAEAPRGGPAATRVVDWKRNLAALWLAEFMAIFGFSFAVPFLPLYLGHDLGVRAGHDLALWTGVAGGVAGLTMAIASPIWGILADRRGRRAMLVRAMLGGAIAVGLMGFAQSAGQLTVLRALQGAAAGTVAAATSLVAAETPRARVAWSLGVLSSSVALGGALGPLTGGLAAQVVGLRAVFVGGGVLLFLASVPVMLVVRESPRAPAISARAPGPLAVVRSLGRPALMALGVLVAAQALTQFAYSATQLMAVLHLLEINPAAASAATGIAFGAAGLATTVASVAYWRLVRRAGYRWVAAIAAMAMAAAIGGAGSSRTVAGTVVAIAGFGLCYGALSPILSSLIGLRTPRAVQSTVYGVSASAIAVGFGAGPFVSGAVAAGGGVAVSLFVAAGVAAALSVMLAALVREPPDQPA